MKWFMVNSHFSVHVFYHRYDKLTALLNHALIEALEDNFDKTDNFATRV